MFRPPLPTLLPKPPPSSDAGDDGNVADGGAGAGRPLLLRSPPELLLDPGVAPSAGSASYEDPPAGECE